MNNFEQSLERDNNYCLRQWNEFTTLSNEERENLKMFKVFNGLRLLPYEGVDV